jgi:PilZ domain-containing protein
MLTASTRTQSDPELPKPGQYSRVAVHLHGRLMRADHSEHDCVVEFMSPGDAVLACKSMPERGERIVAYLDHVGRIEGRVYECGTSNFTLSLNATERKRDKLSAQLTWLANKHELGLPEDRRHERLSPDNPMSEIRLDDGRRYPCRIIDLSMSGAAIEIEVRPAKGTMVTLGNMRGRVVRHFQEGIALEFMANYSSEQITQLI